MDEDSRETCVHWRGTVECFDRDEDAEALLQEIQRVQADTRSGPDSPRACSRDCLELYRHVEFKGDRKVFCDRGYWQNLGDYAFNDEMSSFKTGAHGVHLAKHSHGGDPWYPGDTSACVSQSRLKSGWNDEVSSIYIQ